MLLASLDRATPAHHPPTCFQLESALVRAARDEAAAREAELRRELEAAQASGREQLERAARARRAHERCAAAAVPQAGQVPVAGGSGSCLRSAS